MRENIELFFKDHYSLKYSGLWEYFRARQTDNKLYVLHTGIYEDNTHIGYICWEIDEVKMAEHENKMKKRLNGNNT